MLYQATLNIDLGVPALKGKCPQPVFLGGHNRLLMSFWADWAVSIDGTGSGHAHLLPAETPGWWYCDSGENMMWGAVGPSDASSTLTFGTDGVASGDREGWYCNDVIGCEVTEVLSDNIRSREDHASCLIWEKVVFMEVWTFIALSTLFLNDSEGHGHGGGVQGGCRVLLVSHWCATGHVTVVHQKYVTNMKRYLDSSLATFHQ